MNKVLIIQNDPPETLGLYEKILREKTDLTVIKAYEMKARDRFPSTENFSHFIIGPTPISANNVLEHAFLRKEWSYLQEIVDSRKPCLGVCCGGQMLSKLLGGEVVASPSKEIGGYTITLTDEGLIDPLYAGFPEQFPVFHWHSEMFIVPPGGKQLARGDPCPVQSFRKDNVWGIIFHLEIMATDAKRWAEAYPREPQAIGKTSEQVLNECRENESQMKELVEKMVNNFISQK